MESFGELCGRIVRTVLAESNARADALTPTPTGRLHLPLVAPPLASDAEESAERACNRLPGELCLEMCGDSLQAEIPGVTLDVPTFEALRSAQGNPLRLCELALADEPGRRSPAAPRAAAPQHGAEVGAYLAGLAQLEAACVSTFEALTDELTLHGAPPALIDRARVAQAEERVHVVLVARLAARHGATAMGTSRKRRSRARSLAAFACRNAADGCGTEAFSALMMAWAAQTARDLSMRSLARHIAADEARHADLAFDVQAWASESLPASKVARLRDIRDTAIRNAARDAAPAVVETKLGFPGRPIAERLAELLIAELATT